MFLICLCFMFFDAVLFDAFFIYICCAFGFAVLFFSVLLSFYGCVFGFVLLLSFRFVVLFYFAVGAVCFVNVFSTCAPLYCLNTRSCLCGYAGSQEALCACVHVCMCVHEYILRLYCSSWCDASSVVSFDKLLNIYQAF